MRSRNIRLLPVVATLLAAVAAVPLSGWLSTTVAAQDRAAQVLQDAKRALGGEDKLAAIKAISAEGPFRRSMGNRDVEGVATLLLVESDRMRRSEEMTPMGPGGPTIERVTVLDGAVAWEDMQNSGGMGGPGGGMRMEMRMAPGPGGPGAPGGAAATAMTEEQLNQVRVRRMRVERQRYAAALLLASPTPWVDAGVAESPDGKADILETKDDAGRPVRVFIDQGTHLPLMVQYQDVRPRILTRGPGGPGGPAGRGGRQGGAQAAPPSAEEMQKRREQMQQEVAELRKQGPPPPSTFTMHLSEYKKVDGVLLPHQVAISVDGEPNEEWTVEKFRINPAVKPAEFQTPKKK